MNIKQKIPQENNFMLQFISEVERFSAKQSHKGVFVFHGVTWQDRSKQEILNYLLHNTIIENPNLQNDFISDLEKNVPQYHYVLKMDMVNKGIWLAMGSADNGNTYYELGAFPL